MIQDEDDWDIHYQDDRDGEGMPQSASHRQKNGCLEDAFWEHWQLQVNFGRELTADKSQVAGWLKSQMTTGPEPKPIRTGATLHTLCVTRGEMVGFKLFVRAYGGKTDEDLSDITNNAC